MVDCIGYEVIESKGYAEDSTKVVVVETQRLGVAASLAWILCERWGMVAAKADGEDSAGRQKLAVLTPSELVERSCATAEAMLDEFEKRGWLLKIPMPRLSKDKYLDPTQELARILPTHQLLD